MILSTNALIIVSGQGVEVGKVTDGKSSVNGIPIVTAVHTSSELPFRP
jgi:hypothetical protein